MLEAGKALVLANTNPRGGGLAPVVRYWASELGVVLYSANSLMACHGGRLLDVSIPQIQKKR